jgi:hypothetical protein
MTADELLTAKARRSPVRTPRGIGEVNAVGLLYSWIFIPCDDEPGTLGHLREMPNTDVERA